MKKFVQMLVVLVLVMSVVGCSTYRYENKGGTTVTVKKNPDGSVVETTTTYNNSGSGSGPQPGSRYSNPHVTYGGQVGVSWGHGYNRGYSSGSPVYVPQAPSAAAIMGMIPQ